MAILYEITTVIVVVSINLVVSNCFNIDAVSDKHSVKKREIEISYVFPELKDLGEIMQHKRKPAKRLALPYNFILRPVAEPDAEDYYSQGGGDSYDNYESKDWSDVHRQSIENAAANVSQTELTHIEGIGFKVSDGNKPKKKKTHRSSSEILIVDDNDEKDSHVQLHVEATPEQEKKPTASLNREEEEDYIESKPEKIKTASQEEEEKRAIEQAEKEKAKAEAKKQKILSEVDNLKARHEKEQREISEKLKEDEIFKEEQERDRVGHVNVDLLDKYGLPVLKQIKSEYEDYPEDDSVEDKYQIEPVSITTSKATTTKGTKRPITHKMIKEKVEERSSGKLSVFKNPRAYMIYDDDDEGSTPYKKPSTLKVTTERTTERATKRTTEPLQSNETRQESAIKYSAKFKAKTKTNAEDKERISLVPEDDKSKDGEPTLFFPRKRKNKRGKKMKYYSSAHDSMVAQTVTDSSTNRAVTSSNISLNSTTKRIVPTRTGRTWAVPNPTGHISTIPTSTGPTPAGPYSTGPTSTGPTSTGPTSTGPIPTGPSSTGLSLLGLTLSGVSKTTGPSAKENLYSSEESSSEESRKKFSVSTNESTTPISATTTKLPDNAVSTLVTATGPADSSVTAAEASSSVLHTSSPSASGTGSGTAPDADAESAHEHKKEEEPENFEHEHGGHKSEHAEHHASHGEQGKKAYKGHHEDTKAEKGHHDKENHSGEYHDAAGYNQHHEKASAHFGIHHHDEHGKKQAQYEESGKHSKGHSTKGSHDIHKKEEYEKKTEFFEEEGDSAEDEKQGGHHSEKKHAKGGHFKKNHLDAGHHHNDKGDGAKFEKGGHHHILKLETIPEVIGPMAGSSKQVVVNITDNSQPVTVRSPSAKLDTEVIEAKAGPSERAADISYDMKQRPTTRKGHKEAAGHDSHAKQGRGHIHKSGNESGKKWVYHHGYPAKSTNLVIIDRRTDKFTHGPEYFG